ncbi:MAG: methionine ABC transporter permease, partial [Agathobacter sp.]
MELGQLVSIMWEGILESLYMTVVSTLLAYVFGIPLGVILYLTDKGGIVENGPVNKVLGVIVN